MIPLDLPGVQRKTPRRPGVWQGPLAQREDPLLERVEGYPQMHPKVELCAGDFYPVHLLRDSARPRYFPGGPARRQ